MMNVKYLQICSVCNEWKMALSLHSENKTIIMWEHVDFSPDVLSVMLCVSRYGLRSKKSKCGKLLIIRFEVWKE